MCIYIYIYKECQTKVVNIVYRKYTSKKQKTSYRDIVANTVHRKYHYHLSDMIIGREKRIN